MATDQWDKYAISAPEEKDQWEKYAVSPTSPSSGGDNVDASTLALAGAGIGGLGYLANREIVQPFIQGRKAKSGLREIAAEYGIGKETGPGFVPKALTDKLQVLRSENQSNLANARTGVQSDIKGLSKKLYDLDAGDITTHSTNTANMIKSRLPDIYKGTSESYGKAMDAIDSLAAKEGFQLSNKQFASNVIDRIIEDAQKTGIDSKEIARLQEVKAGIGGQSKLVDAKGMPVEMKMNLSDAKSVISNLTKDDPYSPLSAKVREHWGDFLEKEAPGGVKPLYQSLNAQYKSFAEARNFLSKMSNPATGEFDTARLSKYLADYAKKGNDAGVGKLMKLLSEGNALVPGTPEVGAQFEGLNKLKGVRSSIVDTLKSSQSTGSLKVNSIQQANLAKVQKLLTSRAKANELASIAETASGKYNLLKRGAKAVIGRIPGLMAGVGAGVVESELMNRTVGYDPVQGIDAALTGLFGNDKQRKAKQAELERAYRALSAI